MGSLSSSLLLSVYVTVLLSMHDTYFTSSLMLVLAVVVITLLNLEIIVSKTTIQLLTINTTTRKQLFSVLI